MTTLKVGIASYEEMKARTMSVARGERRVKAEEPKVWFVQVPLHVPASVRGVKAVVAAPALHARKAATASTTPKRTY